VGNGDNNVAGEGVSRGVVLLVQEYGYARHPV
jgi:hypothetical protein